MAQTSSFEAGCNAWCQQQANGTCPVGNLTHTHADGSADPTCKKNKIAGGIGEGLGSVLGGVLGNAAKKAAKITYTCSEEIDYTCHCNEAAGTDPAVVEERLISDPAILD